MAAPKDKFTVGQTVRVFDEKTRTWVDATVRLMIRYSICVYELADGTLNWNSTGNVFAIGKEPPE